ncbi:MAG: hypothetical protein E6Q97_25145 [Desulfurellales bacterium]|nr:MAG: hypothetical protein E6Q97_25145 [Desulfurellales bacterium]
MILDEKLEFADALSVAATTGSALVGDVIDLVSADRRLGSNVPLFLVIQVTTAFATATSATVSFELASDDAAAINTTTGSKHVRTAAFGTAQLTAGKQIIVPLPAGLPDYERYLGLIVVTAGATTTAGAINAFLTNDAYDWKATPEGSN